MPKQSMTPILLSARISHGSHSNRGDRGGTVVKVLRYKSECRWLDSRLSLEIFIDIILPIALWPWGRLSLEQK